MALGLLMSLVVWVDIFIIVRIFLAIISSVILFCPILSFLSYWDFKHTVDYLISSHRTQLLCSFIFSLFSPSCFSIVNFTDIIQNGILLVFYSMLPITLYFTCNKVQNTCKGRRGSAWLCPLSSLICLLEFSHSLVSSSCFDVFSVYSSSLIFCWRYCFYLGCPLLVICLVMSFFFFLYSILFCLMRSAQTSLSNTVSCVHHLNHAYLRFYFL